MHTLSTYSAIALVNTPDMLLQASLCLKIFPTPCTPSAHPTIPPPCPRNYGVGCEGPSHVIVDGLWFVTIPHTLHKSVSWYMLSSLCSSSQDSDSDCISQTSQSIQQELYPCPFIHVPQQHAPVCVPISEHSPQTAHPIFSAHISTSIPAQ